MTFSYLSGYCPERFIKRLDRRLFRSFELRSAVVDIIANLFLQDCDSSFGEEFMQAYFEDGSDMDLKIIRNVIRSFDFLEWMKYDFENYVQKYLLSKIQIDEDGIRVYRSITTTFDWIQKATAASCDIRIGVYWSFKYESAVPHWGNDSHPNQYIFFANVSKSDVDWFTSAILNLSSTWADEQELRLFPKRNLKNFRVETVGDLLVTEFSSKRKFRT